MNIQTSERLRTAGVERLFAIAQWRMPKVTQPIAGAVAWAQLFDEKLAAERRLLGAEGAGDFDLPIRRLHLRESAQPRFQLREQRG